MDLNSCRICLSKTQEVERLNLFLEELEDSTVSDFGQLYEEVLDIPLENENITLKYICNSCGLQLKLFKQLKNKAFETHLYLIDLLKAIPCDDGNIVEHDEVKPFENNVSVTETDVSNSIEITPEYLVLSEEKTEIDDLNECEDNEQRGNEIFPTEIIENNILDNNITENDNIENNVIVDYLDINLKQDQELEDDVLLQPKESKVEDIDNIADLIANDNDLHLDISDEEEEYEVCYLDEDVLLENTEEETDKNQYDKESLIQEDNTDNETDSKQIEVENSFNCSQCEETFKFSSHLKRHMRKMHLKTSKIQCHLCNKALFSEETYQAHMNIHDGLPAYQCHICEKTFNQKVHYNYHILNHKNERKNICDVCQKAFISSGDLKTHMRCHTDERRYKCDVCDKRFRAHTHMANHRYSHFEKQFECPMCLQKYMSPNTLRTHFKDVHSAEVPFECEFCEKRFKRKHHLQAHYRTHRNVINSIAAIED